MSANKKSGEFLKECMADALILLMEKKPFAKITINEIAETAGVNRSTWFRNFIDKQDALTYKLMLLWSNWCQDHNLPNGHEYNLENAKDFFTFNYEIRHLLHLIYQAGQESVLYAAFYHILVPKTFSNTKESYQAIFYSYGLFGLLDSWIKRDFCESPEVMAAILLQMEAPN